MPVMTSVFLFGDVAENFDTLSEAFVRASGGRRARIALLMLPRSEKYAPRYRRAWLKAGAAQVTPIYPPSNLRLTDVQLQTLKGSTGIFMSGGRTALYQRIYGSRTVSSLIGELYESGVPYGGVSAGAKMALDRCSIGGAVVRTRTNEVGLASEDYVKNYRREFPKDWTRLEIRHGIGLVKNCVLEPHFAEWGFFPRLMETMRLSNSRFGIGIDGSICLELRRASKATVRGRGRLYLLAALKDRTEGSAVRVRAYEPGSHFELRQ